MTSRNILVYTRTTGYRHDSIPAGVAAFRGLGAQHGFTVHATEDPATFTAERLASSDAVVFLSTSGDVLEPAGRRALLGRVAEGGGFLGVHSATCTEYDWPDYGALVGARFDGHPEIQPGLVNVVDRSHPATAHLPERWTWTDEWYNFRDGPTGVTVLATVDENSYRGGTMGLHHPLIWYREYGAGRSFYTALGHTEHAFDEPDFRRHLLGALRWAAGWTDDGADANQPTASDAARRC
ncbi:ThuA domain-containing protein [Actinomadura sp. 6N118]|uniref:ThuA domain-containing protein n=1 Tax=Actinomadura sp. 6N118 TaxID=3375151 RepID=UPI0037A38434